MTSVHTWDPHLLKFIFYSKFCKCIETKLRQGEMSWYSKLGGTEAKYWERRLFCFFLNNLCCWEWPHNGMSVLLSRPCIWTFTFDYKYMSSPRDILQVHLMLVGNNIIFKTNSAPIPCEYSMDSVGGKIPSTTHLKYFTLWY